MIFIKLIPIFVIEILARSAGYIINFRKGGWVYPSERIIRGKYWNLVFKTKRLKVGRNVQFEGTENIQLGEGVRINCGCHLVAGVAGYIKMGPESHLAHNTILAGGGGISIGERCMISSLVAIYSTTNDLNSDIPAFSDPKFKPVSIGNDVFIGVGARILPGVNIGDHAIIGAGAVVTKNIPAGVTVTGIPAQERLSET